MDYREEFYGVLEKTNKIALATAVDGVPNVRIVNFCYDASREGVLYFASDRENQKVAEFAKNNKVAFTTVPLDSSSVPHARSNNATIRKSEFSINDVKELFIAKVAGYDETLEMIGDCLDVFEIHIKEACVVLDFDNVGSVSFVN